LVRRRLGPSLPNSSVILASLIALPKKTSSGLKTLKKRKAGTRAGLTKAAIAAAA